MANVTRPGVVVVEHDVPFIKPQAMGAGAVVGRRWALPKNLHAIAPPGTQVTFEVEDTETGPKLVNVQILKKPEYELPAAAESTPAAAQQDPPAPPSVPEDYMGFTAIGATPQERISIADKAALESLIAEGKVTKMTHLWKAPMKEWQVAGSIPVVAALFKE